jgi:2-C-methyl-D-erythritol 4-phosphate cytidylyltransferase
MRYFVVIPAAGSGRRFAASVPKQYAALAGATVLSHALAPFDGDPECARIVVAIAAGDAHWPRLAPRHPRVETVAGGAERAHSVRAGLAALEAHARAEDWVMVHDAARPCFAPTDLAALKRELATHEAGGLLAIPLADTLKRGDPQGAVDTTLDRAGLWRAATPQMFRLGLLARALDAASAAGRNPTDEAQAVEWLGVRPRLVAGRPDNIKVTTADDLELAAAILAQRVPLERQ